jgi:hypothetical protein
LKNLRNSRQICNRTPVPPTNCDENDHSYRVRRINPIGRTSGNDVWGNRAFLSCSVMVLCALLRSAPGYCYLSRV